MKYLLSILILAGPVLTRASVINGGEVKILYPCSTLESLPREKEEQEKITFFEQGKQGLNDLGLVLRYIQSSKADEFTVKYRTNSPLSVNPEIYQQLSVSPRGEFKCEEDVNYGDPLKFTNSCSFKAPGDDLIQEHIDLIRMVNGVIPSFENLRKVEVLSTSWKLKVTSQGPFTKKPSVEMWQFRNECILEVSGKYQAPVRASEAMTYLKSLIKAQPLPKQGNKTGLALGI